MRYQTRKNKITANFCIVFYKWRFCKNYLFPPYPAEESKILQLESEKAAAETALINVSPGNYTQVQKLYEQVESLKQAIDVATNRWLELAEMDSWILINSLAGKR